MGRLLPVKITNGFVVLDENGEDHDHELFNNKDGSVKIFANQSQIMESVNDFNRENPSEPFLGSIIIANVITFFQD